MRKYFHSSWSNKCVFININICLVLQFRKCTSLKIINKKWFCNRTDLSSFYLLFSHIFFIKHLNTQIITSSKYLNYISCVALWNKLEVSWIICVWQCYWNLLRFLHSIAHSRWARVTEYIIFPKAKYRLKFFPKMD